MISKQHMIYIIALCLACCGAIKVDAAFSSDGVTVYQKNIPPATQITNPPRSAASPLFNAASHSDNLWDVLRHEFVLSHYENNEAVREKIEWYMNNQAFLLRSANRAAPYLYYILQQIRKRHLPAEVALLPIVESGYNPFSLSTMGAAGIWQLMPATAAGLGIQQNGWYDGRRDVIASTRGALNHLKYLESVYEGNWLLAFAAYDTGEGNVRAALLKNIRNGRSADFWSLPLAAETRNYVPSLLALAIIVSKPSRYPIPFPVVRNEPYLAQIDVGAQINLKYAASLAGMAHSRLLQFNPGYNRSSTPRTGPFKLTLPIENIERFTENLTHSPLWVHAKWIHYQSKPGDSVASLAKKFKTTPKAIRQFNQLHTNALTHGTDILIPNQQASKRTANYRLIPGDTLYMVRQGDTIASLAKRFHLLPAEIRLSNLIDNRTLRAGERLIIPTHMEKNNVS